MLRRPEILWSGRCSIVSEVSGLNAMRSVAPMGSVRGCGVAAPFITPDGQPYLEVHHIRRLSDGGPDHPQWVVAICPNCHRRAHYAEDAVRYNAHLSQVVQERERTGGSSVRQGYKRGIDSSI